MWPVVRTILLGIWVGGMVTFAFLFAPIAFHEIGPTPAFAATIASCVRTITQTGTWIAVICTAITVFGRFEPPRFSAVIVGLLTLTVVLGGVETSVIIPQMEHTPLLTPAYDALHRRSSALYGIALLAAFVSFVLSSRSPYR
jgi:hypothetical protein